MVTVVEESKGKAHMIRIGRGCIEDEFLVKPSFVGKGYPQNIRRFYVVVVCPTFGDEIIVPRDKTWDNGYGLLIDDYGCWSLKSSLFKEIPKWNP